jgi:hypothetical protein
MQVFNSWVFGCGTIAEKDPQKVLGIDWRYIYQTV